MDLSNYANMSTLLIVVFICQTIFQLKMHCRPHMSWSLLWKCGTTLLLSPAVSEPRHEMKIIDTMMRVFFITYFYVNFHSICKIKKIEHSEKSTSTEWLSKNNELHKFVSDKTRMIYKRCCTVCSVWDSHHMHTLSRRLASFRDRRDGTNYSAAILAQNGLYYDEDSSHVQCCRCLRRLSRSDDMGNPSSWHDEGCEFVNYESENYEQMLQDNQESLFHQQISEGRRRNRSETAQNAAGNGQEGSLPQAASQSSDEVNLPLRSRESSSSSSADRNKVYRSQTTESLERPSGSAHSATFNEHLGLYSRTSARVSEDHTTIISEPALMYCVELTPTRRVTEAAEAAQLWQSDVEIGHDTAVSEAAWASTQSMGVMRLHLPARNQEINTISTVTTRRRRFRFRRQTSSRQQTDSRQQQCCCIV